MGKTGPPGDIGGTDGWCHETQRPATLALDPARMADDALKNLPPGHYRSKGCVCVLCHRLGEIGTGRGNVLANLGTGKIVSYTLPAECKWPAKCPERFVRGVWDRPFGEKIARTSGLGILASEKIA